MIQFSCWRWFFHCSVTHTRQVEQHRKSRGEVARLPAYPEGNALWTIWRSSGLITRETEQNCEADGREQKAILVWGEISHFSSTSRCCYWTDRWTQPRLETGTVCRWGRHTVHTLSAENGRSWVQKGKRSPSVGFPAGLYPRSKISRGKETAFYFLLASYILKIFTTWSNKTTGQTILLV